LRSRAHAIAFRSGGKVEPGKNMKTDNFSAAYAGKAKKPLRRPIPPHTGRNVSQKLERGRPDNVAAAALRCSNEHALTMIKDTLTSRFFCSAKRIG
jgi:hypothetical protein